MEAACIAKRLRELPGGSCRACIGLDGFVDRIIRVVDKRFSRDEYSCVRSLADYGAMLVQAAGLSLNIELICENSQLGGNGPIMAYALARLGGELECIGAFGLPEPAPEFDKLSAIAGLHSVAQHAKTDSYEFEDGKIIASELEPLNGMDWDSITAHLPEEKIGELFDASELIALNNWTMIPSMTDIWLKLQSSVLPGLSRRKRLFFVDLADPSKCTGEALRRGLGALRGFMPFGQVLLSCNKREALQIAAALSIEAQDAELPELARRIREAVDVWCVSVHTLRGSFACCGEEIVSAPGFYVEKPRISIGGGDHFNAGLAFSLMKGLDLREALIVAAATSGSFVRTGESPDLEGLCRFLEENEPY